MMLEMMKKITKIGIPKRFTQSASTVNQRNHKQKVYNFDLRYPIKRFDPNFEQIKPLLTIESKEVKCKEPVIIFPGFEGRIDSVQSLIHNLNRTAHCLQYPFEKSKKNIFDLAASIIQILKEYGLDRDRINVIGHSYGGVVAVETVRQLEVEGKTIRLCLTDSTPHALKVMTTQAFGSVQRSDEFENNLLINISNCVEFQDNKLLEDVLGKCLDWQEKMDVALSLVAERTHNNAKHLKIIANGLYNVLHGIQSYDANGIKLECNTTLIRSSKKVLPFPDDFKVSKLFKKPVNEFHTEGHHLNMLKFSKTAKLINAAFQE